MITRIHGGVTAAKGFCAAVAAAGIKYQDRLDMALIYSEVPCRAAGTFTTNLLKAAPVKWDMELVGKNPFAQAVVINAGIANACTGEEGLDHCLETAKAAAKCLKIPESSVLVASTGVIGMQLPIDRVTAGVTAMALTLKPGLHSGTEASKAIMTTDTVNKEVAVEFQAGGRIITLGGMCKGSGMIHPNMCTMLSFLTTDLAISKELLGEALKGDIEDTYHMISVDGDTSTNDTVLLLSNGMAGNQEITEKNEDYRAFLAALNLVNETLSKKIAGDGEGCTALLEVKVMGAKTKKQAAVLAKSVISSNLVKAAVFGHDANWGRILCAMGYSGADFDPHRVDLYFESEAGRLKIVENGMAVSYSEKEASRILSQPEVTATVDLKQGEAFATAWGCDLTLDYVKINADYRS